MKPTYFPTPESFRAWLDAHHESERELLAGFYKRGSGRPSITWPESVDEALSFGWIDGVRKRVDDEAYTIRFTPRKAASIWSAINVARVADLTKQGRMRPAGLQAFAKRTAAKTGVYSFERAKDAALTSAEDKTFRAKKKAFAYFSSQAPWYQRACLHWIVSAKKDETRARRLGLVIAASEEERHVDHLARKPVKTVKKSK